MERCDECNGSRKKMVLVIFCDHVYALAKTLKANWRNRVEVFHCHPIAQIVCSFYRFNGNLDYFQRVTEAKPAIIFGPEKIHLHSGLGFRLPLSKIIKTLVVLVAAC